MPKTKRIQLDRTKLLGFKLDATPIQNAGPHSKIGAKFGTKLGNKAGTKPVRTSVN